MAIETFIETDKIQHFVFSGIAFVLDLFVRLQANKHPSRTLCAYYALRDVILLGIFKELIDSLGFGHVEIADIIADLLGILFPIFLWFSWQDSHKLAQGELITHGGPVVRTISRTVVKEEKYTQRLLQSAWQLTFPKHHADRTFQKLKSHQAIADWKSATRSLVKTGTYGICFLIYSIWEFFIDLCRMPFWSLLKTIWFGKNAVIYLIDRPLRKRH